MTGWVLALLLSLVAYATYRYNMNMRFRLQIMSIALFLNDEFRDSCRDGLVDWITSSGVFSQLPGETTRRACRRVTAVAEHLFEDP